MCVRVQISCCVVQVLARQHWAVSYISSLLTAFIPCCFCFSFIPFVHHREVRLYWWRRSKQIETAEKWTDRCKRNVIETRARRLPTPNRVRLPFGRNLGDLCRLCACITVWDIWRVCYKCPPFCWAPELSACPSEHQITYTESLPNTRGSTISWLTQRQRVHSSRTTLDVVTHKFSHIFDQFLLT